MSISSDALHCILKNESQAEILQILQHTVNLECTSKNGDTVYHMILRNESLTEEEIIAISQIFRNRGLNPNARNKRVEAPLHLAIKNRMLTVADFLIKCRKPNNSKPNNNTLTLFFIKDENEKFWPQVKQNCNDGVKLWNSEKLENESARFVEWLILRDVDFHRKNNKKESSVDLALSYNLQHILHILLRAMNPGNNQPAHLLLQRFLSRNSSSREISSQRKSVKLWYSNYTFRHAAIIVKILLEKGAALSSYYWKHNVQLAIGEREDIAIIKMLVDYFPSICDQSSVATSLLNQLMEYSCEDLTDSKIDCYRRILRFFVAKGADVNKKNELGLISVQVAAKAKNIQAVMWLDEVGTDFNILTECGKNLLHLLVAEKTNGSMQQVAVFDLLVRKGCPVNAKDKNGQTPLHLAAKNDNVALNKKLIEHDAEIDCRDVDMRTPLHYAVIDDDAVESIELLLKHGANVHCKDRHGKNTLFLAASASTVRKCQQSMINVILKYGAEVNTLNSFSDKATLSCIPADICRATVEEFLKYGLDVNSDFSRYLYFDSFDADTLLERHCIKLTTAKLHCSQDYTNQRRFGRNDDEDHRCYEECLKEIETLKATFVDSTTSLYRFLHMDPNGKRIYISNEKLKSLVDSPVLEKQFPQYSVLILAGYREAVARKSLLEPAKEAWLELTEIHLPDICIERIFAYLSNADLVDMIEAD